MPPTPTTAIQTNSSGAKDRQKRRHTRKTCTSQVSIASLSVNRALREHPRYPALAPANGLIGMVWPTSQVHWLNHLEAQAPSCWRTSFRSVRATINRAVRQSEGGAMPSKNLTAIVTLVVLVVLVGLVLGWCERGYPTPKPSNRRVRLSRAGYESRGRLRSLDRSRSWGRFKSRGRYNDQDRRRSETILYSRPVVRPIMGRSHSCRAAAARRSFR